MIYARVVAKPINSPGKLDIRYEILNRKTGADEAVFGGQRNFSWEEIKSKFSLGDAQVSECEEKLRQGENALIAQPQEWRSKENPTGTSFSGGEITVHSFVIEIGS